MDHANIFKLKTDTDAALDRFSTLQHGCGNHAVDLRVNIGLSLVGSNNNIISLQSADAVESGKRKRSMGETEEREADTNAGVKMARKDLA